MLSSATAVLSSRSLSARRAWIEILLLAVGVMLGGVALRKESVDRNFLELSPWGAGGVALRKESVDRNYAVQIVIVKMHASLSARRAWIEMPTLC